MSAEEPKAASPQAAAPVAEPSSNGDKAANGADAMEVDAPAAAPAEEKTTDAPAPAAEEEEKTDVKADEATPAAADDHAAKESKPASTSSRQTRPKPESTKPASSKPPASTGGNKKVARPKSSLPVGGAKGKTAAADGDSGRTYAFGDIVLGRLRGYPPWPSRVTNPDEVPPKVLAQRPGKNSNIYAVQFFPVGDYAWLQARELQPLPASDIQAFLKARHHKSGGKLMEAYQTAEDPSEWDEKRAGEVVEEADDEEEEMGDVDELEDEEGGQAGGKRKKTAASSKKGAKKAKTEKASKTEADAPKSKSKSGAVKKADKPESKPAPAKPVVDDDPLASDPICLTVKGWRHTLQRAFLGKDLPSAEDMPSHDETFKKIEAYTDMTIQALQYSKIGKVMKKISTLEGIPRDDELHIRERSAKLMNDWHAFIEKEQGVEGQTNGGGGDKE